MTQSTFLDPGPPIVRAAKFSKYRKYRYSLTRWWAPEADKGHVNFIMLNPSVAGESEDDPTVRRCMAYARAWGYRGLVITNLYALVSTDPRALVTAAEPVGPDNDGFITLMAQRAALVCVAWGQWGAPRMSRKRGLYMGRGPVVLKLLESLAVVPVAFGVTQEAQPLHPLRLPNILDPVPWPLALERGPGIHKRK